MTTEAHTLTAARANLVAILAKPTKSTFAQKIRVSGAVASLYAAHRDALFAKENNDLASGRPDVQQAAEDEIKARLEAMMETEIAAAHTAASVA